ANRIGEHTNRRQRNLKRESPWQRCGDFASSSIQSSPSGVTSFPLYHGCATFLREGDQRVSSQGASEGHLTTPSLAIALRIAAPDSRPAPLAMALWLYNSRLPKSRS